MYHETASGGVPRRRRSQFRIVKGGITSLAFAVPAARGVRTACVAVRRQSVAESDPGIGAAEAQVARDEENEAKRWEVPGRAGPRGSRHELLSQEDSNRFTKNTTKCVREDDVLWRLAAEARIPVRHLRSRLRGQTQSVQETEVRTTWTGNLGSSEQEMKFLKIGELGGRGAKTGGQQEGSLLRSVDESRAPDVETEAKKTSEQSGVIRASQALLAWPNEAKQQSEKLRLKSASREHVERTFFSKDKRALRSVDTRRSPASSLKRRAFFRLDLGDLRQWLRDFFSRREAERTRAAGMEILCMSEKSPRKSHGADAELVLRECTERIFRRCACAEKLHADLCRRAFIDIGRKGRRQEQIFDCTSRVRLDDFGDMVEDEGEADAAPQLKKPRQGRQAHLCCSEVLRGPSSLWKEQTKDDHVLKFLLKRMEEGHAARENCLRFGGAKSRSLHGSQYQNLLL